MNNIRIVAAKDYNAMSESAASIVSAQLKIKPNSVLGLATGSTPIGLYKFLTHRFQAGEISFAETITVNLDEYIGLSPENHQSYRWFMDQTLFNNIDINKKNTYLPSGTAKDTQQECDNYDRLIAELGGVDIQLLGLGMNGHIGFNEPSDKFSGGTSIVNLTESTIMANMRFFESEAHVPKTAITMGIRQIMMAKQILLLVSGSEKAEILYRALKGDITPLVPASVLQLHQNVVVVADEQALSYL